MQEKDAARAELALQRRSNIPHPPCGHLPPPGEGSIIIARAFAGSIFPRRVRAGEVRYGLAGLASFRAE
jgi:hypothetical protein